jgi:hypothetical protein
MPSSRDLCLGGEALDATESGVEAAMKFTASNLGMVWWRMSEEMSRSQPPGHLEVAAARAWKMRRGMSAMVGFGPDRLSSTLVVRTLNGLSLMP